MAAASLQCRGVVIMGSTNVARTHMAEGFLRYYTGGALPVRSAGAVHHAASYASRSTFSRGVTAADSFPQRELSATSSLISIAQNTPRGLQQELLSDASGVHPDAIATMGEIGIDISGQSARCTSSMLFSNDAMASYDVVVTLQDDAATEVMESTQQEEDEEDTTALEAAVVPSALSPSTMPSHWETRTTGIHSRRKWSHWSMKDPTVNHYFSTKSFTDHYRGEPMFFRQQVSGAWKHKPRMHRCWAITPLAVEAPLERPSERKLRFREGRDWIHQECLKLLHDMEKEFGSGSFIVAPIIDIPAKNVSLNVS